jgi:hypothetical protein
MCRDLVVVNRTLHVVTWLVDAQECQTVEDCWGDLLSSVSHDTHNDLCFVVSRV